jgi:hypothetical protein
MSRAWHRGGRRRVVGVVDGSDEVIRARQEEDEGAVQRGAEFCRENERVVFAKTTFRHLICDGGSTYGS